MFKENHKEETIPLQYLLKTNLPINEPAQF